MISGLSDIKQILKEKYGTDISLYEESYVNKLIDSRISALNAEKAANYTSILKNSESEAFELNDKLNNVYSEFFRNPLTFNIIEQFLIPGILRKGNMESGELRIWSAGCSAGQEAYSLAITAIDCIGNLQPRIKPRIFGTDKSEREIETARKGVYNPGYLKNCSLDRINKYFIKTDAAYMLDDSVKSLVDFSVFDLINNPYVSPPGSIFGSFDIIMCSNLLFYYKEKVRNDIISRLLKALSTERFLVTGEAEISIFESVSGLRRYSPLIPVFVKIC